MKLNDFEEWQKEMKENRKEKRKSFLSNLVGGAGVGIAGCFFILALFSIGWLVYAAIVFLCWALLEWAMNVPAPTTAGVFAIAFILMILTSLFGRSSGS